VIAAVDGPHSHLHSQRSQAKLPLYLVKQQSGAGWSLHPSAFCQVDRQLINSMAEVGSNLFSLSSDPLSVHILDPARPGHMVSPFCLPVRH